MLKEINKQSLNLHTEMLLRLLGRHVEGAGSLEAGRRAVSRFAEGLGIPQQSWYLRDGSGLARSNLLTAHGLAELLLEMSRHPHAAAFRDSLAIAGVDGTLEERLREPRVRGRIRAKTGTLRHTHALAGYAETGGGDGVVFVIMVNNHALAGSVAVAAVDAIARRLVR
jgi:D-alanyl-D-alanine carboxypeptidase/D-alanyl-D-alanine-endopeptidase (penicillin-binding protein 4)